MSSDPETGPIRVRVDPDLAPLVPSYLDKRRDDVARMRRALDEGDLATVESIAHAIKGSGGGYGFQRLTDLGSELEQAAAAGDGAAGRPLVDAIAGYLDRVDVVYEE